MKKAKKNCRPENPDRIPGPAGSQKILPDKTNKKSYYPHIAPFVYSLINFCPVL